MKRLLLLFAACNSNETRIHLDVTMDPTWNLDSYQLRIGDHAALAQPLPVLELAVPDAMAGEQAELEVWGLAAGQQVAFGMVGMTPVLHSTVTVAVTLTAVSCGTWCTEGAIECSGDGTSTCEMQSNGCVAWSMVTPCPSDIPYCSNAACAATCSDECTTGQTECDSAAAVRICGQYDNDSCLDWSPPMACGSNQTCSNGSCGASVTCALDGDSCDDGNACTTNDTCEGGTCSGAAKCTAPANGEPTCAADGTCGFTCHVGYMVSGGNCAQVALAPIPTVRDYLAVVAGPAGLIYAIGGQSNIVDVATVESYNPSTNTWATRASMPTVRDSLAAAVGSDGVIYAMGGYWPGDLGGAAGSVVATVEAYHPSTNTWTTRAPMSTPRKNFAAAVGSDGLIYAIGGYDGVDYLDSVEAYNPSTDTWTPRAPMPIARNSLAAVTGPDHLIYAIGGYDGTNHATVEAYDASTNHWATRAAMPIARGNLEAALGPDGLIYAIGGVDANATLATVQAYNTATNTWESRTAMPTANYGLGAATASGLIFVVGGASTEAFNPTNNTSW